MDTIQRQIARARNLIWAQSVLNVLAWCLILAFGICFIALLIPKIWYLPYTFRSWSAIWMVSCGAGAALVTLVMAFFIRPTRLNSAIELDRRFGLRERISSALQLDDSQRQTPIGEALLQDAATKAERIDVRDHFPIKSAPHTPWVALPIMACVALFWVPDSELPAIAKLPGNASERLNNIKNQTKPILAQIQKRRESLEEKGLQEAADEFKKLEEKLKDLQKSNTLDTKKLLSDFNEIKKELEQKKESLGGTDSLKKALDNMKNIDKGPADKLADALKNGDMDKAANELDKLLEQMKSGKLSESQKEQLTKQLDQMQKAIEKSLEQQKQAMEETKKELEKAQKAGDKQAAEKLQKKLDAMQAKADQAKMAQSVKAQIQKAQQAMQQGKESEAKQALEELQAELAQMAEDQEALQEMEDLMDSLQDAKKASTCAECDGAGCVACQSNKKAKPSKNAKGSGRGEGEREEKDDNVKFFDSQIREQMRKGETVFGGKVAGPNRKGVTKEDVRETVLNATPDDPDAIENLSLPKPQRDQQRDYFNALRDK